MPLPGKKFDESLIGFYEESLMPHADQAYRLAFALTLSLDGAVACVRSTFRSLAANLEQAARQGEGAAAALVVSECWKAYHELKNQKFAGGQSAVTRVLGPLSIDARAAVCVVDICGLSPTEAASALGLNEKELRIRLAEARRALMATTLEL